MEARSNQNRAALMSRSMIRNCKCRHGAQLRERFCRLHQARAPLVDLHVGALLGSGAETSLEEWQDLAVDYPPSRRQRQMIVVEVDRTAIDTGLAAAFPLANGFQERDV